LLILLLSEQWHSVGGGEGGICFGNATENATENAEK